VFDTAAVFGKGIAMKNFQEIGGAGTFEFYEYNIKCLVGVTVGYLLYKAFPEQSGQYFWLLISVLLSITHDNNSKVAYDRMRGNIVGSVVGLFIFLLHNPTNLLTICLGVAVTITICFCLNLISVSRTALVGFIIVVIYEEAHSSWEGAIYRLVSVVVGCWIGLVINYTFREISMRFFRTLFAPVAQKPGDEDKDDGGE
jgi:uncharacterized membrane protein YgaE (UPF0421/DUF939 family)